MYSFLRLLYFTFDNLTGIVTFHNIPPSLEIDYNPQIGSLTISESNFDGLADRFGYIGRRGVLTFESITLAVLCACCPQDSPYLPDPDIIDELLGFDYDFDITELQ